MNSSLEWNPILPTVPLALGALLILTLLLALEWRRKQRFRAARIACQVVVVVSLLGLLSRPSLHTSSHAGPVLVLTPGYSSSTIDSLNKAFPDLAVISTSEISDTGATKTSSVSDLDSLTGNPLFVAGYGLPVSSLSSLRPDFTLIRGTLPEGITNITVPNRIVKGIPTQIQGAYLSGAAERRWIRVVGPGGAEDSTMVAGPGTTAFEVTILPVVSGPIVYSLEEIDSVQQVLHSSRLPIYVLEQRKIDVLIVSDYPTFEMRYLKNSLADKGHRISMRNRLSKNRYHQEFVNRAAADLNVLTTAILDATDVLILDQATYQTMADSERNQILRSLQSGLGMIFLPSGATKSLRPQLTFTSLENAKDTVRLRVAASRLTLPGLAVKPVESVSPLTVDEGGRLVAGCLCTGDLRIGFQLLRETYQVGLQGKADVYSALWVPLLEKVARERDTGFKIAFEQHFPVFSNQPHEISVISSGAMPNVLFDGYELPTAEDVQIDGLYHATVWADGNRWHTIAVDSASRHFFDLPVSEWEALSVARQVTANENHRGQPGHEATVERKRTWALAFFIMFSLASGYLWLAPKI